VSQRQRDELDRLLRDGPLDLGGDVHQQRPIFAAMASAQPLPGDVTVTHGTLGEVPTVRVDVTGTETDNVIVYFHGGGYALGSALTAVGLAADLARRAAARSVAVDYRLAPEHPHPAAVEDAVAAYRALLDAGQAPTRTAFAGESAGGGLALAALVAIRSGGLPLPSAAVLMSPWVDLTLSGASITANAAVDPVLNAAGLRRRVNDYLGAHDAAAPLISPLFADLAELPPLLIQAGSHEILLDDATRLAAHAATANVAITLEVTPGVPHVFQGFPAILDEANKSLNNAARFLADHWTT
jgi:acetyl esterase/lipase